MASQKTKFVVGLFLVCGIGIALLAFIWLGMSRYFEKGRFYVTYFNESVQGLDKDSPVKYRGVSVGRVYSISVAPDSKLVKVVLKIETVMGLDTNTVAQLRSVGITGSVFIELDQKKRDEPDRSPPLSFPSEYPIVASKPSENAVFMVTVPEDYEDCDGRREEARVTYCPSCGRFGECPCLDDGVERANAAEAREAKLREAGAPLLDLLDNMDGAGYSPWRETIAAFRAALAEEVDR